MTKKSALAATVILMLLLSTTFAATLLSVASADPIPAPLIQLNSPQNNKIYASNTVEINFTFLKSGANITSFSYSLDGQAAKPTNGTTILTGLSSGSHSLAIYGTGTFYQTGIQAYTSTLAVVYFSTVYSTSWIVFTTILVFAIAACSLLLFLKRQQVVARLKGKKTAIFWLGLAGFLFFAALFFAPNVWLIANNYLFPRYPVEPSGSSLLLSIFGLVFMILTFYLMERGTQGSRVLERKHGNQLI